MGLLDIFKKKKQAEQGSVSLEQVAKEMYQQYGSPQYKEDRYSEMIRSASFNPFNLTTDRRLNQNLEFGDMVPIFKREINSSFPTFEKAGMPIEDAISGYVFNMMESYYKNAGFIPKAIFDVIIEQIYEAVKQTKYSSYLQDLDQFKYKTYWAYTHR